MTNPYVTPTITCAAPGCGKTRQKSNHWFMIRQGAFGLNLSRFSETELLNNDDIMPLCGEEHVSMMVARFMAAIKSEGVYLKRPNETA